MVITKPLSWLLWLLLLAINLACFGPLWRRRENLHWLSPRLYFSIALFLLCTLAALSILITGRTYRGWFFPREFDLMILASALSGLAYLIGWNWAARRPMGAQVVRSPATAMALFLRALLLSPAIIMAVIGHSEQWQGTEWTNVYGLFVSAILGAGILLLVGAFHARSGLPRLLLGLAGMGLLLLYFQYMLQQTSRLRFLLLFMPLIALLLFVRRRRPVSRLLIITGAALLIWLFVFYGNARYYIFFQNTRSLPDLLSLAQPQQVGDIYSRLYKGGDLDAFENGMLIYRSIPSIGNYYYGATFATLLTLPIPRAWWPGKPAVSVNTLLASIFGMTGDNFALSLVGESYANFSWPGVFMVFLVFGSVSALFFRRALRQPGDAERWVDLGLFCAYTILVTRGNFHSMTSYYLMIAGWIALSRLPIRILMANAPALWARRRFGLSTLDERSRGREAPHDA